MYSIIKIIQIFLGMLWILCSFNKDKRGNRLVCVLQHLGPSFIKLGQTLSVRPDIVGSDIADKLSLLQDKLPPFNFNKVRKIIHKDFNDDIENLFSEFNEEAVAAASIAQVHKAITKEGDVVAVKILRPKIRKAFNRDLRLFYAIAHFLNLFPKLKRLKFVDAVDILYNSVRKELDLRMEAASASQLKENCCNDKGIYIPKVYWLLTSMNMLTIEWVNGIPINNKDELISSGHDLKEISEKLAISFFNQTYRDGFFHADIHPGNLFVNDNGDIVPVDFGIMGSLDRNTRIFVAEILKGFLEGNYKKVAEVHFNAGYVPANKSKEEFALACRAIGEPILGMPANKISIAKLLALLFKITEDFEMETQPQLLLLQKTMVLVEGVGQQLYPNVNMWQLAEPWIKSWARDNLSIKAGIKEVLRETISIMRRMPENIKHLERILSKSNRPN